MNEVTSDKLKEMKENGDVLGCTTCLGFLDDGDHEYDKRADMFYCPALDEKENTCFNCGDDIEDEEDVIEYTDELGIKYFYCSESCKDSWE